MGFPLPEKRRRPAIRLSATLEVCADRRRGGVTAGRDEDVLVVYTQKATVYAVVQTVVEKHDVCVVGATALGVHDLSVPRSTDPDAKGHVPDPPILIRPPEPELTVDFSFPSSSRDVEAGEQRGRAELATTTPVAGEAQSQRKDFGSVSRFRHGK